MTTPAPAYRQIELNALGPETRRRLIEAIDRTGSPLPILAQRSTAGPVVGWAFVAVLGIAGVLGLAVIQLGDLAHPTQPFGFLLAYGVAFFLGAWGILRAIRSASIASALPFERGRYVFPTDLVIATDSKLTIVPMGRLLKLNGVHRHVNGVYQGTDLDFHFEGWGHERFTVHGREMAEQIMDDLRHAQQQIAEAVQYSDLDVLEAMDLFFEARVTEGWNDPEAAARAMRDAGTSGADLARPIHPMLRKSALLALGAVALAPPFWFARNLASDEAAFSRATQVNSTWAFEAYLRGGGRHAEEVENELLPEAAFAEAREAGTVAALRDFVQQHPNSTRLDEARAAIHQRFAQVREDFTNQAATSDPRMPVFMGHLLDWLEAHDSPPVEVRFFAPSGEALSVIDQNLDLFSEVQGVTGGIAPVSPHFTPERSAGRETHITQVLQRGFAPVFPSDVMQLTHAGRIDPAQQEIAVTRPTFDVTYTIRPSGTVYTSDTSERGFVGIQVLFHIEMQIPDSGGTWGFDTVVEPPEHFTVSTYDRLGLDPSGNGDYQDGIVYSVMGNRAFDNLGSQLALSFFLPESRAYREAATAAERDARGDADRDPSGLPSGLPQGLLDGLADLPSDSNSD